MEENIIYQTRGIKRIGPGPKNFGPSKLGLLQGVREYIMQQAHWGKIPIEDAAYLLDEMKVEELEKDLIEEYGSVYAEGA